jgi:hypothetical protein
MAAHCRPGAFIDTLEEDCEVLFHGLPGEQLNCARPDQKREFSNLPVFLVCGARCAVVRAA